MAGHGLGLEDVIPVMVGGAKTLDPGVESKHTVGHVLPGRVGIEAAVDRTHSHAG